MYCPSVPITFLRVVAIARLDFAAVSVCVFYVGAAWAVFFFWEVVSARQFSVSSAATSCLDRGLALRGLELVW